MSTSEDLQPASLDGDTLEGGEATDAEPTDADADAEPTDADADAEATDADADAEPTDADADAEPTDADADAEPTDADADAEPTDADADAEPTDADADAEGLAGAELDPGHETALGFVMPPAMALMDFVDVVLTLPSTHPVIVLQEKEMPYRELRIPIGGPEGIAIGYAARKLATPRPLTHDLTVQLLEQFNLTIELVKIVDVQGGLFSAEITVSGPTGTRTVDCRPSDAIALALRHKVPVPILADPEVLDRAANAAGGAN